MSVAGDPGAPAYPPAELEALRDMAERLARQQNRTLHVDPETGLMFLPPGLPVLRALLWSAYVGEEGLERVGQATFPAVDFAAVVAEFPHGAHAEQIAAYGRWFAALRLNVPRYEAPPMKRAA